ncbi:hypothetical protein [Flaviaesturariibacter aridisoli]|uniref:General stress protein FMN-binding split barrel domain-containing protein n=1 Tax=Flaviaesturariibacter aridisoli TaxID=2545761 RepID=A0A4R4DZ37_9BACT|nr:hypothetical protein [Flaviaesturariibacter aridisoli]RYY67102.1 MAG: hypothetical protein EOO12_02140 [Chitinophagaceae bacterium]TCZ69597.1 hypothetical protein E0486_12270 [Flaviaesturariibacter aridisoli]
MPLSQHAPQQLAFLQEKIRLIGSAIFFNQSDAVLKLPTSLVSILKTDEYGYVWFFVKKPNQEVKQFEQDIPVRLDFFRKGVDCFLQVSGKGWMVTDPEEMYAFLEMNEDINPQVFQDMVLVKVKMQKAEFYETAPARHSWWQHALNYVTALFRPTGSVGSNTFFPAS